MTKRIKYVCHCDNCGDEFWINKTDAEIMSEADEVQCTTCKKMTPLIVKSTACRVADDVGAPITFCPWCGKKIACPSPS